MTANDRDASSPANRHERRSALSLLRGDRGIGLAELLVFMAVLAVLGTAVVRMVLVTGNGVMRVDARDRSTQALTVALDSMTKTLQSAYKRAAAMQVMYSGPLRTGSPEVTTKGAASGIEMTFTAELGDPGGASLVHWYVDERNDLIEERIAPDPFTDHKNTYRYETQPLFRKVLVSNVAIPRVGQRPIFSYYGPESTSRINNSNDPAMPLEDVDKERVMAAQISLTVRQPGPHGTPASMQNFIIMPAAVRDLITPMNWPTRPADTTPPPDDTCVDCGGLPELREPVNPGGGSDGGVVTEPTGPPRGLS